MKEPAVCLGGHLPDGERDLQLRDRATFHIGRLIRMDLPHLSGLEKAPYRRIVGGREQL